MKCTVLMDNQGSSPFHTEHGLSFYVEVGETRFLLDAGSSGRFALNAELLGISLEDIDFAVLSHGHFDHSDGFRTFFRKNPTAPLYLREEAVGAYFSFTSGSPKFVGMHKDLDTTRFHPIKETIFPRSPEISFLSQPIQGEVRRKEEDFYKIKKGWDDFIPDTFQHQQTCVIQEQTQLILLNSCCHGNILSIIRNILQTYPHYKTFSLIGGLHLLTDSHGNPHFSPESVSELGENLLKLGLNQLYTGHCTSSLAFSLLRQPLGDRLHSFSSGFSFSLV